MDKIEQQHQHFNSVAEEYYKARRNTNHLRFKERLFRYVLKEINVDRTKTIKVLEPMCGFGEGRDIVCKYISDNLNMRGLIIAKY